MKEDARDIMKRLYGDPIDVDKVWEDREAQYEADASCPRLVKMPPIRLAAVDDPDLHPGAVNWGEPMYVSGDFAVPEGDGELHKAIDIQEHIKIVHHD